MIKKVYDVLVYQQTYRKNIATRFSLREGFESGSFFEQLTPHGFRHTFATNCIEIGMESKNQQIVKK